ncbi:MT-A70 family methyltransferase [Mycobacteroides abscessus]|uniref:MT-A70 family methyltransferase n=1 Tax=Mycobacteroides abscessus TaxID=36809 RepID=UPI000C25D380|nr:MT-A70 family methyltransferase [Mycobacteroides abscessus]RIR09484.1 S-adenosylmethionine-binding protein [Mycobacteroides abscessus]
MNNVKPPVAAVVDDEAMLTRFRTIVADPPWQFENRASRAAAENHYETMTTDEICGLSVVPDHAATASHLYLWTTSSHLRDGLDVMSAWGFEYKTAITWVKPQMGMGYYFRGGTEVVLFGVRGSLPTLRRDVRNHFTAPRRAHSQKPREFLELVMRSSPGPYLEVFARCRLTLGDTDCACSKCLFGWTVWGDQSGSENPSQGALETRHTRPLCGRCFQPVPKPKRGPSGTWCSAACRTAAWRDRRAAQAAGS